jgi:hypothetical protein
MGVFMKTTTRRNLLKAAAVGGVTAAGFGITALGASEQSGPDEHGGHENQGDANTKNHTVSFGNWSPSTALPIDRFAADPNPRTRNGHALTPSPIRVHEGDTVSFIISGFHNLLVYGPGTQPTDINLANPLLAAGFPPLINDPSHRVYRGNDPRATPTVQDRVEVVAFHERGTFMVMCGVLPHFVDSTGEFVMFGFVEVEA